ncbi:MAG: hypothetical protein RR073_03855 [Clostridia bacterium]
MKKIVLPFVCLFLLIALSQSVLATEYNIPAENDIFFKGSRIESNKKLSGDGMFISEKLEVNGDIKGDLLSVTLYSANCNANISGNVRAVAGSFYQQNNIEKNFMVAAGEIELGRDAIVFGNGYFFGNKITINGEIKKDAYIYSDDVTISSNIYGRLVVNSLNGKLNILNKENIKGTFVHKGIAPLKEFEGDANYTFIKIDTTRIFQNDIKNLLLQAVFFLVFGLLFLVITRKILKIKERKIKYKKIAIIGVLPLILLLFLMVVCLILSVCFFYFKISLLCFLSVAIFFFLVTLLVFSSFNGVYLVSKIFKIIKNSYLAFLLSAVIYYFILAILMVLGGVFSAFSLTAEILSITLKIIIIILGVAKFVSSLQAKAPSKGMQQKHL